MRILLSVTLLARVAHAGVGGSATSLQPCSGDPIYHTFTAQAGPAGSMALRVSGDAHPLWSSAWCLSTGTGIGTFPIQANATIMTGPCGGYGALALTFDATGASTQLALQGGALCVAVNPGAGAVPSAGLRLSPCAPGDALQLFTVAGGQVRHAGSGLCLDVGTHRKACEAGGAGAGLPFCNSALPLSDRVADLIGRLTLEEKAAMLDTASGGSAGNGVSPYQWWSESLHGLANNVGTSFNGATPASTAFPQPITSSCSFNRTLWLSTARAVSDEVRAFANAGHSGLTMWAPNINLAVSWANPRSPYR